MCACTTTRRKRGGNALFVGTASQIIYLVLEGGWLVGWLVGWFTVTIIRTVVAMLYLGVLTTS